MIEHEADTRLCYGQQNLIDLDDPNTGYCCVAPVWIRARDTSGLGLIATGSAIAITVNLLENRKSRRTRKPH